MDLNQKTVFITGADGFIGSHLTELLVEKCKKVKALSQYNSFNNWGWLEDLKKIQDIEVFAGDVRDSGFCKSMLEGVDLVFHLASLIAIPYSYVAPQSYIETNVKGTLNVCQAALENQCERVIQTSTSEVYGTAKYVPIDEKHPLQPQSPYSASKIGADAIAMSYFYSFNLPLSIARPFNTYGPRQSARAVVPTIITQIASGQKVIKLGDVTPTRDFNYVIDTCAGFIKLAECDEAAGKTVNIGSGTEISVRDALLTIKKIMNSDVEFVTDDIRIRPEKSEVFRLCCDNSLMQELTGFQPEYTLEEGLQETINWFTNHNHLKSYKTDIYNV